MTDSAPQVETFRPKHSSNRVMKHVRIATLTLLSVLSASAQMHKVAKPEEVTRAVGVYEYVGDLTKPRAARLIPVSLFIGGHFEDAAVYMARPIPFALDTGLRYELMDSGVRKQFLDLVAARNFAGSSAAAATAFDDGWFGYGRVVPLPTPKAAKLRPNCGNAHVVEEADSTRPHFGSKSDAPPSKDTRSADAKAPAKDDPCFAPDDEKAEKITLDEGPRDKNSPDPERPTLHRSPETTANNTGANGKQDKKSQKPVAATVTANSQPADDPDRPTIKHRETSDDDPNALPPDPIDLAGREAAAKAAGRPAAPSTETRASAGATPASNDTVTDEGTITAGNTMSGGPVLKRGRLTEPKDVTAAAPTTAYASKATANPAGAPAFAARPAKSPSAIAPPLDAVVAVSDAKDHAAHDYAYHFASGTERAAVLQTLEAMAQSVLEKPSLANDAIETSHAADAPAKPAPAHAIPATAPHGTAASRARAKTAAAAAEAATGPVLADEQMAAFQLYYSAPISYTFTARTPATATAPERFVTVIATTDAEGKIIPSFRSVTDAAHLDRIPRYRLIDAVDADGSNRAELLMELRAQHTRQFALYRLLGNKPDQVFVSGSTLL